MKNKLGQIGRWINKNVPVLLAITIYVTLSSTEREINIANQPEVTALQSSVCALENQLVASEIKLQQLETFLEDPYVKAVMYKRNSKDLHQFYKEEREYPETPFKFQPYLRDYNISTELLAALIAYGETNNSSEDLIKVNSAVRHGNPFSRHFSGNAIDLHSSDTGKFLSWVGTVEGQKWLKEYELTFYIEDNHFSSRYLTAWKDEWYENILINPFATGPHIHLQFVGKRL